MAYDVPQLLGMSQSQLDDLFTKSPDRGDSRTAKEKEPLSLRPEQPTLRTSLSL